MSAALELVWETSDVYLKNGTVTVYPEMDLKERFVYVIETPRNLAIEYPDGISNVCYIGHQGIRVKGTRPSSHIKNWIGKYLILSQNLGRFRIHIAHPRRRNFARASDDLERYLLTCFQEDFGAAPLFNTQVPMYFGSYEIAVNAPFLENNRRRRKASIVTT